ncbi:SURF1 family cytochrome oxidase biogenesis protein [Henriciella aquimarina]|uniref:SURF1 family cytochrome oxidase biogenesis protein n=1 Tax=Henriciella aquimarina TaxID=545261 RepID=UPI000A004B94|nr:SURF1 family cytochrome oxidase biogenesis protein [Henriciella aquimarina]
MSFRPLPVLTVLALVSLAILIWLGNWQYGRYEDKLTREPAEAAAFETVRIDVDEDNPGMAQQVYGIIDGEAIWRRYVPGRIDGEGPVVLALWDAVAGTEPEPLAISQTSDFEPTANVFERPASHSSFAGKDHPEEDKWYEFNPQAMLANLGYDDAGMTVVEPDTITIRLGSDLSRARQAENPYASPKLRDPLPPARHLGYALTWWGLAAALIGVYLAYHHSKGRLRFRE